MKKNFKYYLAAWVVLFVIFNVVAFTLSGRVPGTERFDKLFWTGYIFIVIAFAVQLGVSFYAFKPERLDKFFYRIPLLQVSWTGLVLTLVCGAVCMLVPGFPAWLGLILCFVFLCFYAISVIKAVAAGDIVGEIDDKVKEKTLFVKSLTVDAESLMVRAKSEPVKAACKKVYEAVRYSDPMSSDALAEMETQITLRFSAFGKAVAADDAEEAKSVGEEVVVLLDDRNKKCKLLKV